MPVSARKSHKQPPLGRLCGVFLLSLAACLATAHVAADVLLGDAWKCFLFNNISGLKTPDIQPPVTVTVPDLVGQSYSTDTLSDQLRDRFDVTVIYSYNDKPARTILSQSPDGGLLRKVVPGKARIPLSLTVSVGPQLSTVPDVFGMDGREAAAAMTGQGLQVRSVDLYPLRPGELVDAGGNRFRYVPRGTMQGADVSALPVGTALFTDPPADTPLPIGSEVTLYVLSADTVPSPVCPQLCGLSCADALKALRDRGIKPGKVTFSDYDPASDAQPGTVTSQSRLAGTHFSPDDAVDLVVVPQPPISLPSHDPRHFWQPRLPSEQQRKPYGLH